MTTRPLDGLRVFDFSWVGAGSYTTRILADHGADVIKVESMQRPDQTRLAPPFKNREFGVNRSGYFADRNTSKRSLALNVKSERGREIARELMAASDVVANNFRPGTMDRLGLGYETARTLREDIIFVEMSMQGGSGPRRNYFGYGLTISALSGLHGLSRLADGSPAGTGTNFPDHVPSPGHAVVAILCALRHRERTGKGQHIDISQVEATTSVLGVPLTDHATSGASSSRGAANESASVEWQAVLPCRGDDRWIAVTVSSESEWQPLSQVMGAGVHEIRARGVRSGDPGGALSAISRAWDAWRLMETLQEVGVAAGVVQHAGDLLERDPQLAHRQHFVRLPHPEMGDTVHNAPPFKLGGTPSAIERPSPLLGEHTVEILRDVLGMDEKECQTLVEEGVLA